MIKTTSNRIVFALLVFIGLLTGCLKVDGMHLPTRAQVDQWIDSKLEVLDGR